MKPVHSPAPLSTAPPAGSGRVKASSASTRTVTPVRARPRPSGGGGSSRWIVACPSPTPATSSTELVGPVGRDPITIPRSRARGMGSSNQCRNCPVVEEALRLSRPSPCHARHADPRRAGRRRRGATSRCARSGSACRPRAPRCPSGSTGSSSAWPATSSVEAAPHDDDVLRRVHDPAFVDHLAHHPRRVGRGPYDELVGQDRVVPYVFPTPRDDPGHAADPAAATHGRAGQFCYDTMTLVGPGTWEAARAAVDCALTAVDLVVAGGGADRGVRALPAARPPRDPSTGTAAPATSTTRRSPPQALRDAGHARVAVVDLDAHHGNGTQAIFWDRADVLLRLAPRRPGRRLVPALLRPRRRDRQRRRCGRDPQPAARRGHRRRRLARRGRAAVASHAGGCDALVVSLGVDAAADDPESPLQVTADGYHAAGRLLGVARSAGGGRPGGRLPPAHASAAWSRPTSTDTPPADGQTTGRPDSSASACRLLASAQASTIEAPP